MRSFVCATVILTSMAAGCSKSDMVAVTGTVTVNGKPAEGVEVMFNPQGSGRMATAHTDASGRFSLSTAAAGDGALPGDYVVTLGEYYPPGKPPAMPKGGGLLPSRFPPRYQDPTQSPAKAKVERGGKNDFTFDVKK